MLANTLTLTINGAAKVLERVREEGGQSTYKLDSATERLLLKIRNNEEKSAGFVNVRSNVYLEHWIFATSTVPELYYNVSQTFRRRFPGTDPAVLVYEVAALATLTNANATAICGGAV